jgi:tetratricopeptide (TPR) repeat protein
MLGRMYANLLLLDSATFYFNRALNGYISVDDKKGQATTYFKIGWVHKRKGELKEAMQVDLWALRLMEQIKDKSGIAGAMNRISEDLARQERTKEALEYAKKDHRIFQEE